MEVFFLRHGQTNGNLARRHQHSLTPLNAEGARQAEAVAPEIAALAPTHFISSTHLRAMETTRIVASHCGITPETHSAFEELDRPQSLVGHRYLGLKTFLYVTRWFLGYPVIAGESYQDFLNRIIAARSHLESLPSDARVVVVSHAVFTNLFLEHLCLSERMNFFRACLSFIRIFTLRNTSIVHLQYSSSQNTCGWRVVKR